MKKILLTVFVSLGIISAVMFSDFIVNKNFKVVKTFNVSRENVVKYIKADGIVSEANKREINIEFPFVVQEIYVETGDEIIKGQKLIKLDKESMINRVILDKIYEKSSIGENMIAQINNYNPFVTSPINGKVTKISTSVGSKINVNYPVITVSDLDNLIIKAYIPENLIQYIYVGQKTLIKVESGVNDVSGYVHKINPVAEKKNENSSATYITVEVIAENYDNIKPGINVNVEFEKENKNSALLIPFDSVMFDEKTPYVFINRYGYAVKRYINMGEEYETDVEILDGLNEDENLILNPKLKNLSEGDRLSVIKQE